jgi:hypothetical protein
VLVYPGLSSCTREQDGLLAGVTGCHGRCADNARAPWPHGRRRSGVAQRQPYAVHRDSCSSVSPISCASPAIASTSVVTSMTCHALWRILPVVPHDRVAVTVERVELLCHRALGERAVECLAVVQKSTQAVEFRQVQLPAFPCVAGRPWRPLSRTRRVQADLRATGARPEC